MMRPGFIIPVLCLLAACSADRTQQTEAPPFALADVLGGAGTEGFLRAETAREFSFPEDHGPHPGFRNEWWYFTGNLGTAEGRRFGYQVTFFNAALPLSAFANATAGQVADASSESAEDPPDFAGASSEPAEDPPDFAGASSWHTLRVWMAHVAVTDVDGGEHYAFERFSRESPGLAGATAAPLRVWLDDWQLSGANPDAWQLDASDEAIALALALRPVKSPVLQGIDGLSQKGADAGNASYYYSLTRIATNGSLRVGDETFDVSGTSWLDREWSTSALDADQSGWDWFSLQFDDEQELMYYQLRTTNGGAHPNSQGNWTDAAARQTLITPQDIVLTELDTWTSPTGVVYTTAWALQYAGNTWRIEALLDAQWMNLTIPYWEGAVSVLDANGDRVGRGYLEMVRN